MPDVDRVAHAVLCILADAGRFRCGSGGPDGVVERFGCDHGTLDAVRRQSLFDTAHDFGLRIFADRVGGNYVCVVCGPIADADFGVVLDDLFEANGWTRGRMEERLSLIPCRPLRTG